MKKILVIDDQKSNLAKIKDILEKSIPKCKVLTAQTGIDGLKISKTEQPDTILLDVVMPEMDGYEVCEKLKVEEKTKNIPVILVSAFQKDTESRVKGLKSGADVFLSKPINPAELAAQVSSMLRIRKAENDLRVSENKYRKIFEKFQDIYYCADIKGIIKEISPSVKQLSGYSREDLIGSSVFSVYKNRSDRIKLFEALKKTGSVVDYELSLLDKNGKEKIASVNSHLIYDKNNIPIKIEGVLRDITERKQAENNLIKSKDRFKNLFNKTPISLWEEDLSQVKLALDKLKISGVSDFHEYFNNNPNSFLEMAKKIKILDVNEETLQLYEADSKEEFFSKIFESFSYDSFQTIKRCLLKLYEDKSEYHTETVTETLKGNKIHVLVKITLLSGYENNWARGIVSITDISERKKAEEALKHHAQQLQERNEELDAFSHTVAHDLKNPLGTIMGFADLLFEDYYQLSKDETLKYLGIIINDSKKTQQIINNLLLFASVRKAEIKTEELNMGDIVAGSINRLTPMIEKSNTEIKLPETWPTALGYAPWVEEVWINYLSNAIKYGGTPPIIEIGANTDKAENAPEGMVRFWIRDNGPGISAENQKLLFKQFERLNQVKTEGHGLGLSIVRRIIEKLGGQVGLERNTDNNRNAKGSVFYFTLPVEKN